MPWTTFETAIGTCGIAWRDRGVRLVQLPESDDFHTIDRLASRSGDERASAPPSWVNKAIEKIQTHLAGTPEDLSQIPIDFSGVSAFDKQVYEALRVVPPGTTVTYGDLAKRIGSPGAARAIGRAMGQNPFPLLVPCQRVVGANGKPGGFSAFGGLATKERLLHIEGASKRTSLFTVSAAPDLPYDRAAACTHLRESDRTLAAHIAKIGDFSLSLKDSEGVFAALAESIVYQQLNGKAAATIFGRVRATFPKGKLDPAVLRKTSDERLRAAGLSQNKLASLRDLADKCVAGAIPTLGQLQRMDDEAIIETLTEVRGIGRWTVEMLLIFRLGRPDVLPVADYGIKKGYALLFHRGKKREELPSAEDLVRRGERWRPFRSVASWYLWRATDS